MFSLKLTLNKFMRNITSICTLVEMQPEIIYLEQV